MRTSSPIQLEFSGNGSKPDRTPRRTFQGGRHRFVPVLVIFALSLAFADPAATSTPIVEYADMLTNPLHPLLSVTCRGNWRFETGNEVDAASLRLEKSVGPSPGMTALRSLCLPGWGQFSNGNFLKGMVFLAAESAFGAMIYFQTKRIDDYWDRHEYWTENPDEENATANQDRYYRYYSREFDRRRNTVWILSGVLIYSVLDAYVDAQLRNFESEGNPYPSGNIR